MGCGSSKQAEPAVTPSDPKPIAKVREPSPRTTEPQTTNERAQPPAPAPEPPKPAAPVENKVEPPPKKNESPPPKQSDETSKKAEDSSKKDPLQDLILDESLANNQYPAEKINKEKASFEAGNHCSLMARYISPEMFDKYKGLTSGGLGNWTISRAINTGVMFPRAFMGIHAGDPESYDTFIDIYRPCVEAYHTGFKWDAEHAHRTDLDPANVSEELTPEAQALVASTRIRVARNLAAPFIMNPNGTAESRVAVLDMVRQCAATFPPELAGKVYAHAEMTPEEEKQLIDDHILFKGRDARQAACGYHQYWPAGRGVFCSQDKTFNMWINEGDHLRIMCLFLNSDIKGVLGKLATGIAAMEAAITEVTKNESPIAKHPILGCVTCCPTNLGTGCRASVMMDLPKLIKKLGLHGIDEICAQNHCQARGSTGEFSEVTDSAKCDISNKYRLGYSEVELVNQMIRTANLLAKMENELGDQSAPQRALDPLQDLILDESLANNEYPAEKINKEKASFEAGNHCSLMARYISPEMFEQYKGLTSGGLGNWTISRAINTGVMFPRAFMGIHAGDPESYDTFIDIYRPCVEAYHTGFKWDAEHAHRTDLDPANVSEELTPEAQALVASTRIRVARNLAAPFIMNPNGTAESRVAVLDMVRQCAATFPPELAGKVYAHAEMTPEEEKQLIDDHILFKGRDARQAACGYHQYWPAGRGVFCSQDKTFNMWINEGDHLRIMCLFLNSDIKGVLGKLATGIAAMEAAITEVTKNESPIAKHPILGCVTCCPTNLGTGCRASVMMDLPKLIKKLGLHGIDEICAQNHCQARGSTGEFSEVTDSAKCDISNKYRLGYSEVELVNQMIRTANLLAKMENEIGEAVTDDSAQVAAGPVQSGFVFPEGYSSRQYTRDNLSAMEQQYFDDRPAELQTPEKTREMLDKFDLCHQAGLKVYEDVTAFVEDRATLQELLDEQASMEEERRRQAERQLKLEQKHHRAERRDLPDESDAQQPSDAPPQEDTSTDQPPPPDDAPPPEAASEDPPPPADDAPPTEAASDDPPPPSDDAPPPEAASEDPPPPSDDAALPADAPTEAAAPSDDAPAPGDDKPPADAPEQPAEGDAPAAAEDASEAPPPEGAGAGDVPPEAAPPA